MISVAILQAVVNLGLKRKYKRFQVRKWYGGSMCLDTVGCMGKCPSCWTWKSNNEPERFGSFYSPEEVAARIPDGISMVRCTSGEPTLNFPHLFKLIGLVRSLFLLETNGVLLGEEEVRALSQFSPSHLHVRLSLKGYSDGSSELYFGHPIFSHQMRLVELLQEYRVSFHCCIIDLFPREEIERLARILRGDPVVVKGPIEGSIEIERYKEYPFTRDRVKAWKERADGM